MTALIEERKRERERESESESERERERREERGERREERGERREERGRESLGEIYNKRGNFLICLSLYMQGSVWVAGGMPRY